MRRAPRELQAVRAANGEVVWRASLDAELIAAPALQADIIFLLIKPDQLRALANVGRIRDLAARNRAHGFRRDAGGGCEGSDRRERQSSAPLCRERRSSGVGARTDWRAGPRRCPVIVSSWARPTTIFYALDSADGTSGLPIACRGRCGRSGCRRAIRVRRVARQPAARAASWKRQSGVEAATSRLEHRAAVNVRRHRARHRQQSHSDHIQCHDWSTHRQRLSGRRPPGHASGRSHTRAISSCLDRRDSRRARASVFDRQG